MCKIKLKRLISGMLVVMMLFGGFTTIAAADSSEGSDIRGIGNLTDVLSTIKYAEYIEKYAAAGAPNNANAPISVDVIGDYRPEYTSPLNDPQYIANYITNPNREYLDMFFKPDGVYTTTNAGKTYSYNLIDLILNYNGFRQYEADGIKPFSNVTTIKFNSKDSSIYTELAMRLMDPASAYKADPEKYPTSTLTPDEEHLYGILTNIQTYLANPTRKTVELFGGNSPYYITDENGNKDYVFTSSIYLPDHDAVGWVLNIPEGMEGYYTIQISYYSVLEDGSKKSAIERSVYIDGEIPFYEATYVSLPKTYQNFRTINGEKVYDLIEYGFQEDINGNQIRPEVELVPQWRNISLQDSTGSYVEPLQFYFTAGEHTLQLYAQRESMAVARIELVPLEQLNSYKEYVAKYAENGKNVSGSTISAFTGKKESYIKLEAEYPVATSDATIYPTNDRTSCITSPQHPAKQLLNTLGGAGSGDQKKWSTVGQWVRYAIEVPESGFYKIATRFSQSTLQGSFVSRTLRVQLAGESEATVPFAEAYRLQFDYSDDWQIAYLNNGSEKTGGQEFSVYLEKGVNYIELEANLGDMSDIIRAVTTSLNNINSAYIKFLMLAGSSPDKNRDYGFYRRIPDAVLTLSREAVQLYSVADDIEEITGTKGSHVATLRRVAQLLERMGKDESEIAGNLDSLKDNLGTLGTWISDSKESPLELDYLLICPGTADTEGKSENGEIEGERIKLPSATSSFWQTMMFEFKMFFASFVTDYDTLGLTEEAGKSENHIIVWTTTGRDQANIIRSMINNDFTKSTGIAVNLKLVAGGSLLPSVLAGVGPDISMGHGSSDVINWAIRSALTEITDMGTPEYCAENGIEYDENFDAKAITGFDNVLATFHGESESLTVADKAWFSSAAVVPMTLHEVITKESYDALSEKEQSRYTPYDVKRYADISAEEYQNVDKYEKKYYTEIKQDGKATVYRRYITEKEYQALDKATQSHYQQKADVEYYEKFSLWSLPQEQSFNMLFYRADIFNELGIEPPKTWDDLYAVIGVLQSNNMEIAMPTSLGGFQMFLYQMGGDLYSNGGQTISFDENLSIEAFELMCNFFQSYKFPISYDFSNRFRTGEIPMGVMAYTSYTQLSVFATEIKGMWEFIPLPGVATYDENGTLVSINNNSTSGSSGLIMLKGAKDHKTTWEAWKFMAWFTSASAQSNYASEVTAVLGMESKHPTANKKSLYELPWTSSERDNLQSQFENLVAVPEYPGSYIISRYVNFAFLDVYNSNADPVTSIQKYIVTINAELTRKRQEFGLAYKGISYSND